MADSVGQIGLDLVVNQGQFNKQMKGIQGIAKKAGAALAGAFAVKKIVDFAAQCIELGSKLQEVQNVVDVTFPKMSKQVDEFAKNAAASFGLSETMAKRFTGTFGAMAKAFGFSEQAAYEMATTLTGLAGDVASFYDISQDEAYTKLKSVFTGETENHLLALLKPDYINGLTLLGGDPFEPENQRVLLPFLRRVKKDYPDKDIWAYTGYTWEQLTSGTHPASLPETEGLLKQIDTLVDGPFILDQKNIRLRFRGSENQRIIDVKRSFEAKQVILWEEASSRK